MLTEGDFVECTTRAQRKRHWSQRPTAQWKLSPLCDEFSRGYDQQWVTDHMPAGWRKRRVIAELPSCKQCEKSKQRRIDGRPA